ncbi:hypothetical protein A8B82_01670 [Sulfitobacter sp. EhC04]|uniref:TRAP transporter small permease n=1 Tax=Sulfitobacter sp. EhC04 TaxID=1849168 RepID=UPI0007F53F5D|nr:TRAP transporter small permease [Sulfitobacter sp. EhC04]OAN75665.1 hypothetical protein A8B82_01670 [Sulfitobacter sp. EhC04]
MTRIAKFAAVRLPLWLAAASLFAMMLLTFVDVTMRSFANAPVAGAAELTEILLIMIVFIALPITSMQDRHVTVDLFDAMIPPLIIRWRDALINVLFGALLLAPSWSCWKGAIRTLGHGEVTLYLRIPVGWLQLLATVGLFICALCMIVRGILLLARPELLAKSQDEALDSIPGDAL